MILQVDEKNATTAPKLAQTEYLPNYTVGYEFDTSSSLARNRFPEFTQARTFFLQLQHTGVCLDSPTRGCPIGTAFAGSRLIQSAFRVESDRIKRDGIVSVCPIRLPVSAQVQRIADSVGSSKC
jgi:hypothetical protein